MMLMQHKWKIMKGPSEGILVSWALSHCEERRNDAMEPDKADSGEAINSPIKQRGWAQCKTKACSEDRKAAKALITWGIQVIGMQFTYNYNKISSKWCLIYSITEQKKNSSTNQQIACALLVSWGAAAVPSYKSSVQQLAALMELEPALSSLPGGPQ